MKGFLDRHQNLEGIAPIAKQLKLSTVQCLALHRWLETEHRNVRHRQ